MGQSDVLNIHTQLVGLSPQHLVFFYLYVHCQSYNLGRQFCIQENSKPVIYFIIIIIETMILIVFGTV